VSWNRVCKASDIAANALRTYDVGGVPVIIVNYGAGFRAIPPLCPHMEEPLEQSGVVARCVLTCTKHLWAWNLATLDMQGETERPLLTYPIKQEGDDLLVFVEAELVYEHEEEDGEDDDDFFSRS
jgi:nitrite reductase/ring-hydroxylating ferredoxin subunit